MKPSDLLIPFLYSYFFWEDENIYLAPLEVESPPVGTLPLATHFQSNFQVMEVLNGKLGLQEAFNTIPDIIISDGMMPDGDCVEL